MSTPAPANDNSNTPPTPETLMRLAAAFGDLVQIRKLHGQGVSVNAQDSSKRTPLMIAVREGREEAAKLLLSLDADTTLTDENGRTVVHRAIRENDAVMLRLLVDGKADIKQRNAQGLTPLEDAIIMAQGIMAAGLKFDILLQAGADPHSVDPDNGNRPAAWAAIFDNEYALKRLKEKGADFATPLKDGQNALTMAAINNSTKAIPFLLAEGLSPFFMNAAGRTAREEAELAGHKEASLLIYAAEFKLRQAAKAVFARMLDQGVGADIPAPPRAQFRKRKATVATPIS